MPYRNEIDGLRAIAVIAVIFFHSGFSLFKGGFVGVDIFFVISGYLISKIIIKKKAANNFYFLEFYTSRACRLLPALFIVQLFSFVLSYMLFFPAEYIDFCKSLISSCLSISNIYFWRESGYWNLDNDLKPLIHTWSLSIEEQFYMLFPALICILWKKYQQIPTKFILVLVLAGVVFSHFSSMLKPIASFYLIPTRAWELLFGCLVAVIELNYFEKMNHIRIRFRYICELSLAIAVLLIFLSILFFDQHYTHPGIYTVFPCLATAIILLLASPQSKCCYLLRIKPLIGIGLISYSLYLWHQPIFAFARALSIDQLLFREYLLLIVLIFSVSFLSWKFIESPFRNNINFKKHIWKITFSSLLFFIAVGLYGYLKGGIKERTIYKSLLIEKYDPDNIKLRENSWSILRSISKDPSYFIGYNTFDKELWFNLENNNKKILVIGNSHSKCMYNILHYYNREKHDFQLARYGIQINEINSIDHEIFLSPNFINSDVVIVSSLYSDLDIKHLNQVSYWISSKNKDLVICSRVNELPIIYGKTIADVIFQKYHLKSHLNIKDLNIIELVDKINKTYYQDHLKTKNNSNICKAANNIVYNLENNQLNVKIWDRQKIITNKKKELFYAINKDLEKYLYDSNHLTLQGAEFIANQAKFKNLINQIL